MNTKSIISEQTIHSRIFIIRGQKVMLDRDLANLYGVETKALMQAVNRNLNRFPKDFMYQLTQKEFTNLKSQFVTSSWGGLRKLPHAFTEHGILMLSSVLRSKQAIEINIQIMRTFTKLREMLETNKELKEKIEKLEKKNVRLVFINYINKCTSLILSCITFPLVTSGSEPSLV